MSETRDHVSVRLDNILLDLPSSPSKPTIFKVEDNLRGTNPNLYDPKVVSIGPFHRGKADLQKMEQHKLKYLKLIHLFIGDASPWPDSSQLVEKVPLTTVDHLLGLLHKIWCSAFAKTTSNKTIKTEEDKPIAINSASELQEAGIKFKKSTKNNILDIKFITGTITIPEFTVSDETDSTLKNLIAYEHSFSDNHPKFVTDYAFFLHCLINSSKDVEILRRRGILTNYLGDDRAAYQMFNRLGQNILVSNNFCYAEVCDLVNGHGGRRRNRWMAMLRRNYFNSPWAFVSFLAASMLLLLTLTQTVFSVLSYENHK